MNALKYFLFATMLVFAGCADDREPGPQGLQGEKGDKGEDGMQGTKGTANVLYSDWFALNSAEEKFAEYVNASTNRLVL